MRFPFRFRWALLALAVLVLPLSGCLPTNTSLEWVEFDPVSGAVVGEGKFRTDANYNLANTGDTADNNRINPLPILGGGSGVDQVRRTASTAVTEALDDEHATIELPNGFKIYGTVDHATPIRERWIGIRGALKSVVTGTLGVVGLTGHYGVKEAEVAAQRAATRGAQGVEREALRQATAQQSISSERDIALETIQNQ